MMSSPWCPRGCNWNPDGMQAGITAVNEQLSATLHRMDDFSDRTGVITITCPVCDGPIRVEISMEPVYECRKGTGWKS